MPDCICPFVFVSTPPLASDRDESERIAPCELFTSPAMLAAMFPCAASTPPALLRLPACAAIWPAVMIFPPTFDREPALLPGAIVRVPVPASRIVPPSLLRVAGASVRSVLFVWIVPPFELSSVLLTLTPIGDAPYCVIVPP
ncbi:hypothetical protein LMG28614_06572 [Paraburkholderia ultramafica]|uniref:Uncharacterized protein n=1 Tax=Paraburkholderia ultramafica TaxID=1544867 RepID=A0A6S7D5I2_9BURK|nr:hypothetical protein LMG28614_06572 [Paraburkholderia ultramafica]